MINSKLTDLEQRAGALFPISAIKTGLKGPAWCQCVVGKSVLIQNNYVSVHQKRKSAFYPNEPIILPQWSYKTGQI